MTDVARQKFAALMSEVEDLEEVIAGLQARCQKAEVGEANQLKDELLTKQRLLGEKRTELQRISNGCGKSRTC